MSFSSTAVEETTSSFFTRHLIYEPAVDDLLDEFLSISETYADLKDPTSIQLWQKCSEISKMIETEDLRALPHLASQIHAIEHILVNCLDLAPTTTPVTASGRLWDQTKLEHVRKIVHMCPFTRNPLERGAIHHFGKSLTDWISHLKRCSAEGVIELKKQLEILDKSVDKSGFIDMEALEGYDDVEETRETYLYLAGQILEQERALKESSSNLESLAKFKALEKRAKERIENDAKILQESIRSIHEEAEKDLKISTEAKLETIARLRGFLEMARAENRRLTERLAASETTASELSRRVAATQSRLRDAEAANKRNYEAAHNSRGGGCSIM